MPQQTLIVDVNLGLANARFIVQPADLAPWTKAYFQGFSPATATPELTYHLRATATGAEVLTPAGAFACSRFDAPAVWDATLRNVIRYLAGSALLHAALIRFEQTAILIMGQSGAGKTTLLNRLLDRGWQYWTDDAVRLGQQGLQGLPRCLEWPSGQAAKDASVVWHYAVRSQPIAAAYGHRAGLLPQQWLPWQNVGGVIVLSGKHQGSFTLRPIRLHLRRHWLNPPTWNDWRAVRSLLALPAWLVGGGDPDAVAHGCAQHVQSILS